MPQYTPSLDRRTALQTVATAAVASITGCLSRDSSPGDGTSSTDGERLQRVAVDGTTVVVDLAADANVDQINLVQPNGELFEQQAVAAGVQQVSFEIGTTYEPGEYDVVVLRGEKTVNEHSIGVQPDIHIREVGLYRNHSEKPWDEVYGESETGRLKNGEAFVTVENTGTGPDAVIGLQFTGDVPNPIENPRGNGIHGTEQVVIPVGESVDLFSSSYPFGTETGSGMGCLPEGNSGQFTVAVETLVGGDDVLSRYNAEYSGSDDMTDCDVTIREV